MNHVYKTHYATALLLLVRRSAFFGFFLGVANGLSGCADARIISQPQPPTKATKVTVSNIVWKENPSLSYKITKTARYTSGEIEQTDKTFAQGTVIGLLLLFRQSVPPRVATRLTQKDAANYPEATLELTPIRASIGITEAVTGKPHRTLDIRASVKEKQSGEVIWSTTIQALAPPTADNPEMVENFVSVLIKEIRNVGLVS